MARSDVLIGASSFPAQPGATVFSVPMSAQARLLLATAHPTVAPSPARATASITPPADPSGGAVGYPAGVLPLFGIMNITGSDYSGISSTTRNKVAVAIIGNGNPDLTTLGGDPAPMKLIYTLPVGVYDLNNDILGVSYNQANSFNAIAKDGGGNRIKASIYDFYLPILDNVDYQNQFASHMLSVLAATGLDGLYYDNVDYDWHNIYGAGATTSTYPDEATWRTKQASFYANVNKQIQDAGFVVAGNARAFDNGDSRSNTGELTNIWWDFLTFPSGGAYRPGKSYFDLLMVEFYLESFRYGSPTFKYTMTEDGVEAYSTNSSIIAHAHSLGAAFGATQTPRGDTTGDNQIARYSRASCLLNWDTNYYDSIQWRDADDLPGDSTSFLFNVGFPTSSKTTPQANVEKRTFQNGIVILNANNSGSITQDGHTVPFGDAYIGAP